MTSEEEESASPASISYTKAASYWSGVAPTVEGMLGGFGKISPSDIEGSTKFLKGLFKLDGGPGNSRALDCGAGIGRVTKFLLQKYFQKIDLVEQNQSFLDQALEYLDRSERVGEMFCSGLQDFAPAKGHYDVIWCQWVLGHLPDEDLEQFFKRCMLGLKPNGLLVIKENVTRSEKVEVDEEDSSVTRPDALLKQIFLRSGLTLLRAHRQLKFPSDLYPVWMYALRPKTEEDKEET